MATRRQRRIRAAVLSLAASLAALGCDGTAIIAVDVVTDYRAGAEFDALRVRLVDADGTRLSGETLRADGLDLEAGARVLEDVAPVGRTYAIEATLLRGETVVAERRLPLTLSGSVVVSISIDRPPCGPERCNGFDDDCDEIVDEADAEARLCDGEGTASACEAGECVFACAEGRADCDEEGLTGCEVDLLTDATSCGECGLACPGEDRCDRGRCRGFGAFVGLFTDPRDTPPPALPIGSPSQVFLTEQRRVVVAETALSVRVFDVDPDVDGAGAIPAQRWQLAVEPPSDTSRVAAAIGVTPSGDGAVEVLLDTLNSRPTTWAPVGAGYVVPANTRQAAILRFDEEDGSLLDVEVLPETLYDGENESVEYRYLHAQIDGAYVMTRYDYATRTTSLGAREAGAFEGLPLADTITSPRAAAVIEGRLALRLESAALIEWAPSVPTVIGGEVGVTAFLERSGSGSWAIVGSSRSTGFVSSHARGDGVMELRRPRGAGDESSTLVVERVEPDGERGERVRLPTGWGTLRLDTGAPFAVAPTSADLYVGGALEAAVDLGGGVREPLFAAGAIASATPDGQYRFDAVFEGEGTATVTHVLVLGQYVVAWGSYTGEVDFGGPTLPPASSEPGRFLLVLRD